MTAVTADIPTGVPHPVTEEEESFLLREKPHICFFTGHRRIPAERYAPLQQLLLQEIDALFYQGYDTFLCGGARGFDLLAAAAVLKLQRERPGIRLWTVIPCREQSSGWPPQDRQLYDLVLQKSTCLLLSENYTKDCMKNRNRYLVTHASLGIAYCLPDAPYSGTAQTVRYAEDAGVPVINLAGMQSSHGGTT